MQIDCARFFGSVPVEHTQNVWFLLVFLLPALKSRFGRDCQLVAGCRAARGVERGDFVMVARFENGGCRASGKWPGSLLFACLELVHAIVGTSLLCCVDAMLSSCSPNAVGSLNIVRRQFGLKADSKSSCGRGRQLAIAKHCRDTKNNLD